MEAACSLAEDAEAEQDAAVLAEEAEQLEAALAAQQCLSELVRSQQRAL